jgi:hypothetical protein
LTFEAPVSTPPPDPTEPAKTFDEGIQPVKQPFPTLQVIGVTAAVLEIFAFVVSIYVKKRKRVA